VTARRKGLGRKPLALAQALALALAQALALALVQVLVHHRLC